MFKPIEVKPLANHTLWIRYDDGVQGEVDLSHLVGRGVFALWQDDRAFENVTIGLYGEIRWSDDVELCPDSLYLRLTGKAPEEVFPNLARAAVGA
jgi:hypothetical protein